MADFLAIYISEAHAQDQWPLGRHVQVNQHKNLKERIDTAKYFVSRFNYQLPVVVDNMENSFMNIYFAHPERFFVVCNGLLTFKARPDGAYYRLDHLVTHLQRLCQPQ